MKLFYVVLILSLYACHNSDKVSPSHVNPSEEKEVFFPVTEFINGQIAEIKEKGVTPVRYLIKGKQKDSSWLNMHDLKNQFSDFLIPEIDSVKLASSYTARRFYDQTLNEITLMYEANQPFSKNIKWLSWNVYINPETGKVDRIYLLKRISENQTSQLTWIPYKNSKAVNVFDNGDTAYIENEVNTKWEY